MKSRIRGRGGAGERKEDKRRTGRSGRRNRVRDIVEGV
jgi:hypothetical protein